MTAAGASATLAGTKLLGADAPGYWEVRGYHNRGDPWAEQRYSGD